MISNIKKNLGAIKHNYGGWTTKRKILVIESDDWGSVRIPNKASYNALIDSGIPANKCPFLSVDNFEQIDDFQALFSTMEQIQSEFGKSPKITANYIMANPDYKAIEESNFNEYKFISLKQKLINENSLRDYQEQIAIGSKHNWFYPQLHGREHVNISLWMRFLKDNSPETRLAFNNQVFGVSTTISSEKRRSFLPALDFENVDEFKSIIRPSLIEGQKLFEEFFGYYSKSFIAPNYTWDANSEEVLSQNKVKFLQSSRSQIIPVGAQSEQGAAIRHKTGDKSKFNQTYLVRNAIFEPSTIPNKRKHLDDCLSQINIAFLLNKPAILSMHRLNFMGGLNAKNREENLSLFKELIESVIKKHPKIEFLSSDELGELIQDQK